MNSKWMMTIIEHKNRIVFRCIYIKIHNANCLEPARLRVSVFAVACILCVHVYAVYVLQHISLCFCSSKGATSFPD